MGEYTFSDLIVNPEAPGLEDLIGKEVYFNDAPVYCVRYANEKHKVGILKSVRKEYSAPFFVEIFAGCTRNFACIIPKKEEPKPEYIPFKNIAEFLYAYSCTETKNLDGAHYYLDTPGIWLKYKSTDVDVYGIVTDAWDNGLAIRNKTNTYEATVFNDTVTWDELCKDYTFLDGTPCGRLKESK